jgi:hypothetical protein
LRKVSLAYHIEATSTPRETRLCAVSLALGPHAGGIAVVFESTTVALDGSVHYSGEGGWLRKGETGLRPSRAFFQNFFT